MELLALLLVVAVAGQMGAMWYGVRRFAPLVTRAEAAVVRVERAVVALEPHRAAVELVPQLASRVEQVENAYSARAARNGT